MRVISYGGGTQSTALLILAVQGAIGKVDAAIFANVGDDSEKPQTIRYVREIATPFGAQHGIPVIETCRRRRNGEPETLMQHIQRRKTSIPIPVRMDNGAPGRRSCTHDFKIKVVDRWLRENGVSKAAPAECLIGFSWDEIERVSTRRASRYSVPAHPLLALKLTVSDCQRIILDAGLPLPPKSACYFCPFQKPSSWARMRRDEPVLFFKAVDLERMINRRRENLGRDHVYLSRFGKPLDNAIAEEQPGLDFGTGPGETCDEGYCWT